MHECGGNNIERLVWLNVDTFGDRLYRHSSSDDQGKSIEPTATRACDTGHVESAWWVESAPIGK